MFKMKPIGIGEDGGDQFSIVNTFDKYNTKEDNSKYNYRRVRIPNCTFMDHQKEVWNAKEKLKRDNPDDLKMVILEWSRRNGKDNTAINCIAYEAYIQAGNNYYVFPEKRQAREAIFEGIDSDGRNILSYIPKELIHRVDKQSMTVYVYSQPVGALSTIQFTSSDADTKVN